MRTVTLTRYESTNEGTFGEFVTDTGKSWKSGELNWHDNKKGISCIPEGEYVVIWVNSLNHGMCYYVSSVPNREGILIHSANWMGDLPLKKQLEGCIALGESIGVLDGQKAILKSKLAISQFEEEMNGETFKLTIKRKS